MPTVPGALGQRSFDARQTQLTHLAERHCAQSRKPISALAFSVKSNYGSVLQPVLRVLTADFMLLHDRCILNSKFVKQNWLLEVAPEQ